MPKIPDPVLGSPLPGLERIRIGKVRDTYTLPGFPNNLLVVTTDRISIFDFVLNASIPYKGEVLNATNVFWREKLRDELGEPYRYGDLVACGIGIDTFLPLMLRGDTDLQRHATVVEKLDMIPFEMIVRGYLTGTGWKEYQKTNPHVVCGHTLPDDLHDGSELPTHIFTPTTKAEVGHDKHVNVEEVRKPYPLAEDFALRLYGAAADYARRRSIIIADTKFEFGSKNGIPVVLGDEVLTPDSSRFWDAEEYAEAQANGKSPQGHDKQFVREWGKTVGIDKLDDPEDPEAVERVHATVVPNHVVEQTTAIYLNIFERLTGMPLEKFQGKYLGISAPK